jgi:hypothetical protein
MLDDIIFRIALAPSALLFWCRYIAWPLAVVAVIGLIYFRLTPHPERRRMVGCGAKDPGWSWSGAQANSLARQATVLLQQGLRVADSHAYFCGMGLEWMNGTFVFDAVQDGEIVAPDQVALHGQRRRQFLDPDKFCEWLAEELVKHPRGPTSEISYWRLKCQVDEFKGNLLDQQCDRHTGEFPPC